MAIGMMCISAAAVAALGNQTTLSSAEIHVAAAAVAQEELERAQTSNAHDFRTVNSTTSVHGILRGELTAELLGDFSTKRITARAWSPLNPAVDSAFVTLISNSENVESPDTCDSMATGDWSHPDITSHVFTGFAGIPAGAYEIGDVDAFHNRLYVAIASSSHNSLPSLFTFDISDPINPAMIGSIDNNALAKRGLSAIRAVKYAAPARVYVYGASFGVKQLQVFDVTSPGSPTILSSTAIRPTGEGSSIYYRNNIVYLGLTAAADVEFNTVNVSNPVLPVWSGGYSFGSTVEHIYVRGEYAYLATNDTGREFVALNIANPSSPFLGGAYDAPGTGGGFGRKIYVVGERVYLGRSWVLNANTPELHLLANQNPTANPVLLAALDVGSSSNPYGVYGVMERNSTTFILTRSGTRGQLHIFDVSNPSLLAAQPPLATLDLPNMSGGIAMDCEGNVLYVASVDLTGNSYLSIVAPG
jgi:hypothetical protein